MPNELQANGDDDDDDEMQSVTRQEKGFDFQFWMNFALHKERIPHKTSP